ncbi:hypothetical protein EsH8_VII_000402 [Colletotrichum jinshuiense]
MAQQGGTYKVAWGSSVPKPEQPNSSSQAGTYDVGNLDDDKTPVLKSEVDDEKCAVVKCAQEVTGAPEKSDFSHHDSGQNNSENESNSWEVVDNPDDEGHTHRRLISSSYNLQVGWGKWKFTLLSWDVKIRTEHTHHHEDERQTSG